LIADDVGLGKTIEAGLIAQELIHTHRASNILVLCPSHLKQKWVDEMAEKFGLEFRIIEGKSVIEMRREFGPTINPWASFPRLVTSIDYLKTEHPRRLFLEFAMRIENQRGSAKPWDLLILDEAHNVAPAGRKKYVRDSERTSMMRELTEMFEHKLFLTATPHNGYRESFTGLLELLDNLRFSRGTDLDKKQLQAVTIRRLKQDIKNTDGTPRFAKRVILPRDSEQDPELYVDLIGAERESFDLLAKYTKSRLAKVDRLSERPTQFVLTLLKKRALSSPMAFRESLITHSTTVGVREELDIGDSLFRVLEQRESEDWSDDDEKEAAVEAATSAASRLCKELSSEEKSWLTRMAELATSYASLDQIKPDSKASALLRWIEQNLRTDDEWNDERVIIFTEYRHTQAYLERLLRDAGYSEAVKIIRGGMPNTERIEANSAFQSPPEKTKVRILLATDAASEGADFQKYCRHLIHYEIPWNPVRLEQRNGRIDRHGQRAAEVRIHHFVFRNQEDSEFLQRIVEKVETIRADLGSVGALIAENVRKRALGHSINFDRVDMEVRQHERTKAAKAEFDIGPSDDEDVISMVKALNEAKTTLGLTDEAQMALLECAFELEGCSEGLRRRGESGFALYEVPNRWSECKRYLSRQFERVLTFSRSDAREFDDLNVVHLEHPLMRRAMAAFRIQMWRGHEGAGLNRVTVSEVSGLEDAEVTAWGRLVLLGPNQNLLHEGLVRCDARFCGEDWLGHNRSQTNEIEVSHFQGDFSLVRSFVGPHIETLTALLKEKSDSRANELKKLLEVRGVNAEKHSRSLASERIRAIRKEIGKREKDAADDQLLLFDTEERNQYDCDSAALNARLSELESERETEPKRQRALYRVTNQRVYPVALEIRLPEGGLRG